MTNNELKLKIATALDNAGIKATQEQINGLSKEISKVNFHSKGATDSMLGGFGKVASKVGFVAIALGAFKNTIDSLKRAMDFEAMTHQFKYFTNSLHEASAHMKMLRELGATPPFSLKEFADASRSMMVFSDGALGMKESLELVGDAAAAIGQPVQSVGEAVARAYAMIRDGEPVGRAASQLRNMGLITPKVATELKNLQESGAKNIEVWNHLTAALEKYNGAMKETEKTGKGALGALGAAWDNLTTSIGERLYDGLGIDTLLSKTTDALTWMNKKYRKNVLGEDEGIENQIQQWNQQSEKKRIEEQMAAEQAKQDALKADEEWRREYERMEKQYAAEEAVAFAEEQKQKAKSLDELKQKLEEATKAKRDFEEEHADTQNRLKLRLGDVKAAQAELEKAKNQQRENLSKGLNDWLADSRKQERDAKEGEKTIERNRKRAERRLALLEGRGSLMNQKTEKEIQRLRDYLGDDAVNNANQNVEDAKQAFRDLNDKAQQQVDNLNEMNKNIAKLEEQIKKGITP